MPGLQDAQHCAHRIAHTRPRHGASARHCAHDTAMEACDTHGRMRRGAGQGEQGRGARRKRHSAQGRAALCLRYGAGAPRHGRPWPRHGRAKGHDTATVRTPGRAWVPNFASWVLMHLTQFFDLVFDSVLFLSHRLDPDHEHCS